MIGHALEMVPWWSFLLALIAAVFVAVWAISEWDARVSADVWPLVTGATER